MVMVNVLVTVCFFKQNTAYEMRISDWSSDVCSSDLGRLGLDRRFVRCSAAVLASRYCGRCAPFPEVHTRSGVSAYSRSRYTQYLFATHGLENDEIGRAHV